MPDNTKGMRNSLTRNGVIFCLLFAVGLFFKGYSDHRTAQANLVVLNHNMEYLREGVNQFYVEKRFTWPVPGDSSEVIKFMPRGKIPTNPYTHRPVQINWFGGTATRGNLSLHMDASGSFFITTMSDDGVLAIDNS